MTLDVDMIEQEKRTERIRMAVMLLAAGTVFLLICLPYLQGRVYTEFDLREQFIPWRLFYSLSLEQNDFGVWNPFLCRGYDHHGEGQSGLFHPAHLLIYKLLPAELAIIWEMIGYFPFAVAGMFLCLRQIFRIDRDIALFGGSAFAFSSFFYAHFPHVNLLWVTAHLPWALWTIERTFHATQRQRWACGFGLVLASMLLLGHPQMVWVVGLASLVLVGALTWHHRRAAWRPLALLATAAFAGLMIGAVQILPTLDFLQDSPRADITPLRRSNFSLHPLNLVTNLAPFLFVDKSVGDLFYEGPGAFRFLNSHQEYPSYLGVSLLTVIFVGAVWLRCQAQKTVIRHAAVAALVTTVAFGALALGKYGGLHELLRWFPLVSQFRAPSRYICVVMLVVAGAAALVIHGLRHHHNSSPPKRVVWLPFVLALLVAVVAMFVSFVPFRGVRLYTSATPLLLLGPAFALAATCCIWFRRRNTVYCLSVLMVLCLADLCAYALPILRRSPTRSLTEVSLAKTQMRQTDHQFRRVSSLNEQVWDGYYLANGYLGLSPPVRLDLFNNRDHLRLASVDTAYGTTREFPVEGAFPRARLVPTLQPGPLAQLSEIDPAQVALGPPGVAEFTGPPMLPEEEARIVDDGYSRLLLDVYTTHRRLLVLSDRWSPHWQAWVDGEERPVIPLFDKSLRGIIIEKDDRHVVMAYHSKPLYHGLCLACCGVLVFIAVWLFGGTRSVKS